MSGVRRLAQGVAVLAAGAAVALVVAFGDPRTVGHSYSAAIPTPGPSDGVSPPVSPRPPRALPIPSRSAVPPVPVTPAAMIALLARLLPPGEISDARGSDNPRGAVALVEFRRLGAVSELQLMLGLGRPVRAASPLTCASPRGDALPAERWVGAVDCAVLPNGFLLRQGRGVGCARDLVSEVERRDGVRVRMYAGRCGPGRGDRPGGPRHALTLDEMQLVTADEQWGPTVRADLLDGTD